MERQKYPVSTSSFERIRRNGYVYIDKTDYIYHLVNDGVFYFLSRPRRFGKSLLLSTLEAYFRGRRELFKGLLIDRMDSPELEQYPVLHLNLTGKSYTDKEDLTSLLDMNLSIWEAEYKVSKPRSSIDERFEMVIMAAAELTGKKVVVLVDEYDAPLCESFSHSGLQEHYRQQLYGFYSVLKKMDDRIQFCMLTGVTKFGKLSVFSGLNNMRDISFENEYAGICGITEQELHNCLRPGIEALAYEEGWELEDAIRQLKNNYDGYHFSGRLIDIYNPFSVLNALVKKEISDYWCASGMPTLLSESLRHADYDLQSLNGKVVSASTLDNISVYQTNPVALFYQTGYLTIKAYDKVSRLYEVGYPNREVERGILGDVLKLYVPGEDDAIAVVSMMRNSFLEGRPEKFVSLLKSFLSDIPSKLRVKVAEYENYYHTIFYCITSLIGLSVDVEYNTSEGFIDMVVKTEGFIYIIELKVNGSALDAIRQIEEKHYASPFKADSRRLCCIGLGFSKKTATVDSVKIVEISK